MNIGKVVWRYGDGKTADKIHITADEGKMLTKDGIAMYNCVDVDSSHGWYEVDAPDTEEE